MKVSRKELLAAIQNKEGSILEIAAKFKITPRGLRKRIQENPDLKAAQAESRERLVDIAESRLGDSVRRGEAWAVKFTLETWGKHRGFGKEIKIETDEKPGVIHMYFPDDGRSGPDPLNVPASPESADVSGKENDPIKALEALRAAIG